MKAGGLEASEFYKRVPDMEGTWRVVTQCGMENYLSALGVTGSKATEMITSTASDQFTIERQSGGKIKVVTNSKYFPQEVINRLGETYTLEMQGFGTIEVKIGNTRQFISLHPSGSNDRAEGHHSQCVEVQWQNDCYN